MEFFQQQFDDIIANLSPLDSSWNDETAEKVIAKLKAFPTKENHTIDDVVKLLDEDFENGLLISRLFLSISKDELETQLSINLGSGGIGLKRYRANPTEFISALTDLGLLHKMDEAVNYKPTWDDILVERLKMGRGKAIRGQKRGRDLEDFAEAVIKEVFGEKGYEIRCNFTGATGEVAKCDFAIPNRHQPRILIEAKGYGATGSKMTDIIGDLNIIVREKRHDTTLLFITDGLTWKRRTSDLKKIIAMQNRGQLARIYTTKMVDKFKDDLITLKSEHRL